jgi:uncharacterized protein (DUF924 family)
MISAAALISFWFSDPVRARWFNSTPEFDAMLRAKYLDLWESARAGALSDWESTPDGALALVIVLDQFPLNMFRGDPRSFATEAASRAVAGRAIARGFDQALTPEQQSFLYMPYMHSEDLSDQDRSVALFEAAGLLRNLEFARHHREIVKRFARFPHRNAVLGRSSTPEEQAWLASPDAFKG